MDVGQLIESVAFDAPTTGANINGRVEDGWTEQFTTRAKFLYLRGSEVVQAARLEGKQPVVMTVRADAISVLTDTDWRIRDLERGDTYNIRSVVPTDDRLFLEITAERGVAV